MDDRFTQVQVSNKALDVVARQADSKDIPTRGIDAQQGTAPTDAGRAGTGFRDQAMPEQFARDMRQGSRVQASLLRQVRPRDCPGFADGTKNHHPVDEFDILEITASLGDRTDRFHASLGAW